VVELGAGLAPADVSGLAPAVEALLGDPAYAAGAAAVGADQRALPVVDEAVALLRGLAAPLLAARR